MFARRRTTEKAIALLLLLTLFMPQVSAFSGLENGALQLQSPPRQTPASTPVGPLPPGTVTYDSTWNSSKVQACTEIASVSQPLAPFAGVWTTSLTVPQMLFMGNPVGSPIAQTYNVFANGTFVASDARGDSYIISSLQGFPKGNLSISAVANSTFAEVRYAASSSGTSLANITISYSVRQQFCQPAGLEIAVAGDVNWGEARNGTLSLMFTRPPPHLSGHRAWFGNASRGALGFDWSDSAMYSPSFDAATGDLSWRVGSSFDIDPLTIGIANGNLATAYSGQRLLFDIGGYSLSVFWNGAAYVYSSCLDSTGCGSAGDWTVPVVIVTTSQADSLSMAHSGDEVCYGRTVGSSTEYYRCGLFSAGSMTWTYAEKTFSARKLSANEPSAAIDTSGNLWLGLGSSNQIQVWECDSASSSCKWASELSVSGAQAVFMTALSSGHVAAVYSTAALDSTTQSVIDISTCSGKGCHWSGAVATSASSEMGLASVWNTGDTLNMAYEVEGTGVEFASCAYPCSSMAPTTVWGPSTDSLSVAIATNGNDQIVVLDEVSASEIDMAQSSDNGSTFTTQAFVKGETSVVSASLQLNPEIISGFLRTEWTEGTANPWSVIFASAPSVDPQASASSDSWSRPGLSPYEAYFQQNIEYVSPGNGLLGVEQSDLTIPGRGMDLVIGRVFSTPGLFKGTAPYEYDNYTLAPLGYGWSLNFPWMGANALHLADGQVFPYQWSGSTFAYHNATDFVLTRNADYSYLLSTPSGQQFSFGSNENLLSIVDSNGNTISFRYSSGHISQIIDTIGRAVNLAYNGAGQLASISYAGETWTYGYEGGNLVSATDPLGRTTVYEYNDGLNRWLITGIIYPTKGGSTYSYGSAPVGTETSAFYVTARNTYSSPMSSSLSESDSISYNIVNGQVMWSNSTISNGTAIQGHLNSNFLAASHSMKTYDENSAGAVVRVTEQDYDASGRIIETRLLSPTGAQLAYSADSYDDWGNVVYSRDNVGKETWFSYANTNSQDTFGTSGFTNSFYTQTLSPTIFNALVGEATWQDGTGNVAQESYFRYDSAGNLLEQKQSHGSSWLLTDFAYDQYGNQLSVTNARGNTTYYHYSSTYQHAYLTLTSTVVSGKNVTTSSTFDPSWGRVLSQTDPKGNTTSYSYDGLGRLKQATYPAVNGITTFATNDCNDTTNTLTLTDTNGNVAKERFDGLGRMTSLVRYNGSIPYSTENFTYNWLGSVSTETTPTGAVYAFAYDQDGRLVKATYPDGNFTTRAYDDVNNVVTVTDSNGHPTAYAYDRVGSLVSVKEYYNATGYYQTSYVYDLSGNLKSVTDAKSQVTSYQYDDLNRLVKTTFPDGSYSSESYDSVGSVVNSTDPMGRTTTYSYDELGRLGTLTYPDKSIVNYTYDSNGNRLSEASPVVNLRYSYDALNRLTNKTMVLSGSKYTTLYGYDNVGNVLSMKYPDGYVLNYTYDALNRVEKMGTFASFTYNLDNTVSSIKYGNGVVTSYSYDQRARPTLILSVFGTTRLLDLNYTYDSTGNILHIGSENYSYDWLNRLAAATGPWGTTSYAYDSVGNMVNQSTGSTTTSFLYGQYNRLSSAGAATFTYNLNGDTTGIVNGSTIWQYGYDYANRLVNATENGQLVQTDRYSSNGNRVEQTQGTSTTVYTYEGFQVASEKNLTSGTTTDHFYADGLQLATLVGGTSDSYMIDDALGSVRLVTAVTGAVIFSTDYRPYGLDYGQAGYGVSDYTGTGQDALTNLYYFGTRYYDATIGRFITEDTNGGALEDPLSLNRYEYARDNPLRYVDPNGHAWWNNWNDFVNTLESGWNGLPYWAQIGILVGIGVAVGVTTTVGLCSTVIGCTEAGVIDTTLLDAINSGITSATATDIAPAATPDEEADFAAFEQAVYEQGPKFRGMYTEEVYKGYLEKLGLREGVDFEQQVKYQAATGEPRYADFVIRSFRGVQNLAVDVKGGGMWGWSERGLSHLPKSQLGDYLFNMGSGRFGGILYVNVPLAGHYGFSETLQTVLDFFGASHEPLSFIYGGMP